MERGGYRLHLAGSWRPVLAGVACLGVVGAGPVLAGPPVTQAPPVLHPNHFAPPSSSSTSAGWSSSNWSGYAQTGSTYHSMTGRWAVPSVSPTSGSAYSAAWIGIDGFSNNS